MADFGQTWKNAESESVDEPEAGNYKVAILRGNAWTADSGDYAKLYLKVLDGPAHVGEQIEHFMGFGNEVGARVAREALLAYGLRDPGGIGRIEDLDDRIGELAGTTAEVTVGYNAKGYVTIKVFGSRPSEPTSDIPTTNGEPEQPRRSFAEQAGEAGGGDAPWTSA